MKQSIVKPNLLLVVSIVFSILTIVVFVNAPPAIDMHINIGNDYKYVDVIISKIFICTVILYVISFLLTIVNIVLIFNNKIGTTTKVALLLRILAFLVFFVISFYIFGELGLYSTFDIRFVMPFRSYHPAF